MRLAAIRALVIITGALAVMVPLHGASPPAVSITPVVHAGGGGNARPGAAAAVPSRPLDLAAGEQIYKAACQACHGTEGTGGHGGGSTLLANSDVALIQAITTTGRNNMPTFRDIYDVNQIRDGAEYIQQVLARAPRR